MRGRMQACSRVHACSPCARCPEATASTPAKTARFLAVPRRASRATVSLIRRISGGEGSGHTARRGPSFSRLPMTPAALPCPGSELAHTHVMHYDVFPGGKCCSSQWAEASIQSAVACAHAGMPQQAFSPLHPLHCASGWLLAGTCNLPLTHLQACCRSPAS